MNSALLLVLAGGLISVPGIPATLLLLRPGQASPVIRVAALFGLGFVAAGGLAFCLAASHLFRPTFYIAGWLVLTALLWLAALWHRRPLRECLKALASEFTKKGDRLVLILGACVVIAIVGVHLPTLHYLGASRYIYYLNGQQIANAHGIPAATLEYGQSWPPATDKVMLDSFTGVLAMLGHNAAAGPGVLELLSVLGAAIGYWAVAWAIGLRRTGILMPLLMMASWKTIPSMGITVLFWEYRAENFGRALAFCAVAVGIYAFRRREAAPAVAAGLVLAAASGSHLIPVVAAVILLVFAAMGEIVRSHLPPLAFRRRQGWLGVSLVRAASSDASETSETSERLAAAPPGDGADADPDAGQVPDPARHVPWWMVLRQGGIMAGLLGGLFLVIRVTAGGAFGLTGAGNPASYSSIPTRFDPTLFLYAASVRARLRAPLHWHTAATVISTMMTVARAPLGLSTVAIVFAVTAVVSLLLLLFSRGDLRIAGLVGTGLVASVIAIAVGFDLHYQVWVEATFGLRRLGEYVSFGFALVGLSIIEQLILAVGRRALVRGVLAAAVTISFSAWLLPGSNGWSLMKPVSQARVQFFDWVRSDTACGARFLADQRTEGTFSALSGRYALLEGMGSFLRPHTLNHVVDLTVAARKFFRSPRTDEAFLRQHEISYVVAARGPVVLGYPVVPDVPVAANLSSDRLLHKVFQNPYIVVYSVRGARPAPVSPLLTGPYLHCEMSPIHF